MVYRGERVYIPCIGYGYVVEDSYVKKAKGYRAIAEPDDHPNKIVRFYVQKLPRDCPEED